MTDSRAFDIVLFGATGFTGGLVADYLAVTTQRTPLRWAVAGRDRAKLEALRARLADTSRTEIGIVIADTGSDPSLEAMARQTRVVLTTVGPYIKYGESVVRACIRGGADYADITGEPEFVDGLLARHHSDAARAGVRIVNCCGFDSIPHDLGVFFAVSRLPRDEAVRVEAFVRANGTFSGGTWQSAVNAMARLGAARTQARSAAASRSELVGRRVRGLHSRVRYERALRSWVCPLPTIDPQIVLRSARDLDEYGPDFSYGHYAQIRSTATLVGGAIAIGSLVAFAQVPATRKLLLRFRSSGDGPSAERRARGWFQVTFRTRSARGEMYSRVSGGDPGYGETAKMVAESALCLAFDRDRLSNRTGVLTPASAMAQPLLDRLIGAGIRFETIDAP